MENIKNNTFLSKNAAFGLLIGLGNMLATYIFYKSGRNITLNQQLTDVILLLTLSGTFIGVRKYREESLNGVISYGQALAAATLMIAVSACIYGIFIYALYHSVPELQEHYVSSVNQLLKEVYKGSPLLNDMTDLMGKLMKPGVIAFSEAFNKLFTGFIFALLLAGILRRKHAAN